MKVRQSISGWTLAAALLAGAALRVAGAEGPAPAQVHVTSDPSEAVVTCDGEVRSATPLTLADLAPGSHLIVARKQGFGEVRRTVLLDPGQRMALELKLEPILGLILVHAQPTNATLQIDGADRGATPALVTDLPLGRYRLKVSAPGFLAKELDLNVENRTPQRLNLTLVSDSATLELESEPPGARVVLNGVDKGTTPCTIERIPEGESTLALALDGYEAYSQTLKLTAGQTERLRGVLKAVPAELSLVSLPAGARVYVDNQFKGEAPLKLAPLEPGTYRVRAELAGYETVARDIVLAHGANLTEEFRLEPNSGRIQITTEPDGVTVLLDGKEAGKTTSKPERSDKLSEPLILELLPAGEHEVELTRAGYYSKKVTVEVERERTVTLHQNLLRRFIVDYEVQTQTELVRGALVETDPQGNVKMEIRPGIFRTIPQAEIRSRGPLREVPQ
jgi:hypothetical protein